MQFEQPKYYDNTNGSLYKLAQERNWNTYIFDIVKRLSRNGNKDDMRLEIDKSIFVLKLYKDEINPCIVERNYNPVNRNWSLKLKIFVSILETNDIDTCISILQEWKSEL